MPSICPGVPAFSSTVVVVVAVAYPNVAAPAQGQGDLSSMAEHAAEHGALLRSRGVREFGFSQRE
jgi:hypothetical protein